MNKQFVNILTEILSLSLSAVASAATPSDAQAQLQVDAAQNDDSAEGAGGCHGRKHFFERETFGGNGRTGLTCHGRKTGTVSPEEARQRLYANPFDPLFLHNGSDDELGNGVSRMLALATILVEIPLPPNVRLADDPTARSVTLRRGIPTTLSTPTLDPILMFDGRDPSLGSYLVLKH